MAEGGLGGGGSGGREWCEVGDGGGVRGTEQVFVCIGGEDVFEPEEGKMIIFKRWGDGQERSAMVLSKSIAMRQVLMGLV